MDNLCQAYHWRLDEVMDLTLPQIHMLSHAAKVNYDRSQERMEREKKRKEREKERDRRDPLINGKRMSEMTMDEMMPSLTAKDS